MLGGLVTDSTTDRSEAFISTDFTCSVHYLTGVDVSAASNTGLRS